MINYREFYEVNPKQFTTKKELRDYLTSNARSKSDAYVGAVGDGWYDNFAFEDAKMEELKIQN